MKKPTLFWEQVEHNHGSVSGHSSNPRQERWKLSRHRSQHNNSPKSLQIEQTNENPSSSFSPFRLRSFSSFSGMAMILALPILAQKISYIALLRFKSRLSNPSYEFSHSVYLEDLWKQDHRLWSMQAHFFVGSSLRPVLLILHMLKFYFELMDEYSSNIYPPCAWIRVLDQTEKPGIRNDLIRLSKKKISTSPATQAR
jgi:hypothetical protein